MIRTQLPPRPDVSEPCTPFLRILRPIVRVTKCFHQNKFVSEVRAPRPNPLPMPKSMSDLPRGPPRRLANGTPISAFAEGFPHLASHWPNLAPRRAPFAIGPRLVPGLRPSMPMSPSLPLASREARPWALIEAPHSSRLVLEPTHPRLKGLANHAPPPPPRRSRVPAPRTSRGARSPAIRSTSSLEARTSHLPSSCVCESL